MNIHTLYNLQEAYLDVYELDEAHGAWTRQGQSINDYSSYAQEIGHDDPETRRELRNLRRRKGHGPKITAHAINKANFDIQRAAGKNPRTPEYRFRKRTQREQAELYDIILSHLLDEGYADCLGSAEIIVENMSDEWLDDILNEAQGSYGQTPKAAKAFRNLYIKRARGAGTLRSTNAARKHDSRVNDPDVGHTGRKSPRPVVDGTRRVGLTQWDRDIARQLGSGYADPDDLYHGPQSDGPKGSLPKGRKLTRQRKTGVSK